MKKLLILLLGMTLVLSGCADAMRKSADHAANAPVTAPDDRTTAAASTAPESEPATSPFTNLPLLAARNAQPKDPQNTAGRSTERREHSFGVSDGERPHEISVAAQTYFKEKGFPAIVYDDAAKEKVIYLTFDCGWENGCTADILDVLKEKKVPAAFFCTLDHIRSSPALIARMIREGHIVGNHSTTHPDFSTLSRARMAQELLTNENELRTRFGYFSPYFRFPMGAYNENALELVGELGYTAVFWSAAYEDWDTEQQRGADYAFDTVTARLHPGAILLLHSVSVDNALALGRIIDHARAQGYEFRPLTAYGS